MTRASLLSFPSSPLPPICLILFIINCIIIVYGYFEHTEPEQYVPVYICIYICIYSSLAILNLDNTAS